MFETGVVRANDQESGSGSKIGISFCLFFFYNMKVCCVFSLESPHRGDSTEYTEYTLFNIKRRLTKIIANLHLWDFFPETQK